MAWYFVLLALAVAVTFIDRQTLTWVALGGAIAAGVVGSYSSLQGLLIWPAGLALLYYRRRTMPHAIVWVISATVTTVGYFTGYSTQHGLPGYQYALSHPMNSVKFYLFAVGDVTGIQYQPGGVGAVVILFGVILLALAVYVLVTCRRGDGGAPIGTTLVVVGLLFALLITDGRSDFGYYAAAASRYRSFDLLIPMGIFLALLEKPAIRSVRQIAAGMVALVLVLGYYNGAKIFPSSHARSVTAVHVLRSINHESAAEADPYLDPLAPIGTLREQAQVLRRHQWSLFAP